MKTRPEIKTLAKEAMGAQRGTAILLTFTFALMSFVSGWLDNMVERATGGQGTAYWIVFIAGMFILWVMMVNMLGEYIKLYKREYASAGEIFTGLGVNFWRKLGGMAWMTLWLTLWSIPIVVTYTLGWSPVLALLFTIPVIVMSMAYFFTPNILADCPSVKATQALKICMRITKGHRGAIFIFVLSFFGWFILTGLPAAVLAFGGPGGFILGALASAAIYLLYVGPYFWTADAGFYLELRDKALRDGVVTHEELGIPAPVVPHEPMIIN
ncbi:MAG: DUF975 family protein [Oscillospiraceae bacterium]|nr:DUF975 family protein [Oscillospiraceae bacterium]